MKQTCYRHDPRPLIDWLVRNSISFDATPTLDVNPAMDAWRMKFECDGLPPTDAAISQELPTP